MFASIHTRHFVALFFAGLTATASGAGATDKPHQEDKPEKATCVKVTAEARYSGIGYDHLVHLDNECAFAAKCKVSTNVNKDVQTVTVPSKERETVLTWRGSPASEFTPKVACYKRDT